MDKDEKIEFIKLNFLLSKNKHQLEGDKTVFDSELIIQALSKFYQQVHLYHLYLGKNL